MRILTVDVGTGTQDVLLFDSDKEFENSFKLVMPSPTVIVANMIRRATQARQPLVLCGSTMGGGPCHWAAMDHQRAGLSGAATPNAARTFGDDLDAVAAVGIRLVSDDDVPCLGRQGATVVQMRDLCLDAILDAYRRFGVDVTFDALAVAVFDHGAAPPGYSDRVFRFDYLRERLAHDPTSTALAFLRPNVPVQMTRLRAVAVNAPANVPLLLMDTAAAAILGALDDPHVAEQSDGVVVNVGNFHCLAFHLRDGKIVGLFEHHTGELTAPRLGTYVDQLRRATISNDEVFADNGHGAILLDDTPSPDAAVSVTGPRRALLTEAGMRPYRAVPHGDMLLAGNTGLLRAFASHQPAFRDAVTRVLDWNLA